MDLRIAIKTAPEISPGALHLKVTIRAFLWGLCERHACCGHDHNEPRHRISSTTFRPLVIQEFFAVHA